jgi:hypothetical protein
MLLQAPGRADSPRPATTRRATPWLGCAGTYKVRSQRHERLDGGATCRSGPPRPLQPQPLPAPRPPGGIGADPLDRPTIRQIEATPFVDRHLQLRAESIALGLRLERSAEVATVDAPLQPPTPLVLRRPGRSALQREQLDALPHRANRRRSNRPSVALNTPSAPSTPSCHWMPRRTLTSPRQWHHSGIASIRAVIPPPSSTEPIGASRHDTRENLAERGGFEPPVTVKPQRFSRPTQSSALPSLRQRG